MLHTGISGLAPHEKTTMVCLLASFQQHKYSFATRIYLSESEQKQQFNYEHISVKKH